MDRRQDDFKGSGVLPARARNRSRGAASIWLASGLAMSVLIAAGVAFRIAEARFSQGIGEPIKLPVPLSNVPLKIGDWVGADVNLPSTTQDYMRTNFADDYISRQYVNRTASLWASLYLVYCSSRPAGILGHKPRVCYPGSGWIWDSTVESQVTTGSSRTIKCLIHSFHMPMPTFQQAYVLNFYVLNGRITLSEKEFSGILGRRPNLDGDPARYVAQVQITSGSEESAKIAAGDMIDTILLFLPDEDGRVGAAGLFPDLSTPENSSEAADDAR